MLGLCERSEQVGYNDFIPNMLVKVVARSNGTDAQKLRKRKVLRSVRLSIPRILGAPDSYATKQ